MLELDGIETAYGASPVLFGVSLAVRAGEVVTLLGRNGMGKTTTVRTVMGLTPAGAGRVMFEGHPIRSLAPHAIARLGIGLVPEGRQIFPNLTVRENLVATAADRFAAADPWTAESVFALFPRLRGRAGALGSQISGGEQQMLAIGRALMTNPKLLILDEATEGLAPLVRGEIWASLKRLRQRGQAILLIDKNLEALLALADRHYVLEKGRVAWAGTSAQLAQDPGLRERYLGV